MIQSKYNFSVQQENFVLLYNSASGNCIVLSKSEYHNLLTNKTSKEQLLKYQELGFLVDKDYDETKALFDRSKVLLSNRKKQKFRILTTTACNAKCPYCYERGVEICSMDEQMAISVAKFILEQSRNMRTIEIEWFGGEPLLNIKAIDTISKYIKKNKKNSLKYETSIITNGYLIDNETIVKMKTHWNTYQIQITLDGLQEEYEKIKGLGSNSFIKVIQNIENVVNAGIKVNIRLNFDNRNIKELKKLVEYLSLQKFANKVYVYPAKINDMQQSDKFALEQETIYMYDTLHDNGFLTKLQLLPRTMKTPCAAIHNGYFTINANGQLFKCDRKLLNKNSIGTVEQPSKINYEVVSEWEKSKLPQKCIECKLLPLCWGGCVYDRLNNLDKCGITIKIVENNINLILSDYLKDIAK